MTLSAEQILAQVRALSPAERLYVVERIVHDVAAEVTPVPPTAVAPQRLGALLAKLEPLDEVLPNSDIGLLPLDDVEL